MAFGFVWQLRFVAYNVLKITQGVCLEVRWKVGDLRLTSQVLVLEAYASVAWGTRLGGLESVQYFKRVFSRFIFLLFFLVFLTISNWPKIKIHIENKNISTKHFILQNVNIVKTLVFNNTTLCPKQETPHLARSVVRNFKVQISIKLTSHSISSFNLRWAQCCIFMRLFLMANMLYVRVQCKYRHI